MSTLILSGYEIPFDLDLTFSCGQIFGWKIEQKRWKGVHKGRVITLSQDDNGITYEGCEKDILYHFLGLQDNPQEIFKSISTSMEVFSHGKEDSFFSGAYELSKGIRILRQDPWECLISFICSSNSNVRTIGKRIAYILSRFGQSDTHGENLFPHADILSECHEDDLRECLTGYRAPYLIGTAEYIRKNPDYLNHIYNLPYPEAKKALMVLPGVGPKVADCVLLFAFERMESVPVDIRIRKIITRQYGHMLPPKKSGKDYSYDTIAEFCRNYFGSYAGYAQQYLFATRDMDEVLSHKE